MKYKGIELEGLDKKVKLSHSRVMETDEGTDWIEKLLTCDKAALTPTQFHEVSALSSVINMDYQICNGGIGQYVGNGYHEYRAPYSDDDVEHYGAVEQVYMLRALADFGDNVFPYADSCNREVRQWANLFDHIVSSPPGARSSTSPRSLTGRWRRCPRRYTTLGARIITSVAWTTSPSWRSTVIWCASRDLMKMGSNRARSSCLRSTWRAYRRNRAALARSTYTACRRYGGYYIPIILAL